MAHSEIPHRDADMIVHSAEPYNAEPSLARLRARFVTEAADFYVRSHGELPRLDPSDYRLRLDGRVRAALDLSLADLRALAPQRTVQAVLQCAGNRREDLQAVAPTSGDPWAPGAIGNARWTGLPLAELLRAAGSETRGDLHVAFTCADTIDGKAGENQAGENQAGRLAFGVSIPMHKALHEDVLLAWEMNGAPLAAEHGAPLRLVVPGYAGVRSPKWLLGVTVQDHPSESPVQRQDYMMLPPDIDDSAVDWRRGVPINEMPLNAAICEPARGARLPAGETMLRGYATASGRRVVRVDVSVDGGGHWMQATLGEDDASPWSWVFWEQKVRLPAGAHELVVRAWDSAGQTQPASTADVWNCKGYLSAAWHRVSVDVA